MNEILIWSMEVKNVIAFSKKWLATCMTPEACWLGISFEFQGMKERLT